VTRNEPPRPGATSARPRRSLWFEAELAEAALADVLGSTLALADVSGTIQTQYTYEPFGLTTATGTGNTNQRQYTGRENDGTGLYFYRARYYSPTLHRFISEDPLGLSGGLNPFAYAEDRPTIYTDPFGLKPSPGFGQSPGRPDDPPPRCWGGRRRSGRCFSNCYR
jgi:RHS repeat-associated protein